MSKRSSSLAESLGNGYAHFQHGIDRLIGWGFRRMRDTDRTSAPESSSRIIRVGKKTLSFIGRAGDAYYRKYDELKNGK